MGVGGHKSRGTLCKMMQKKEKHVKKYKIPFSLLHT